MTDPTDPLDEALSELAAHDVGHWRREHVRLRAHAALDAKASTPAGWSRRSPFAICAAHLGWAIARAAMILVP